MMYILSVDMFYPTGCSSLSRMASGGCKKLASSKQCLTQDNVIRHAMFVANGQTKGSRDPHTMQRGKSEIVVQVEIVQAR